MYWFGAGSGAEDDIQAFLDGNPVDRNILIFLICAGLAILLTRRVDWTVVLGDYTVVWLFYAYVVLSVFWSPYPFVSLKRVIRELGNVVMTLVILTEADRLQAVRQVLVRCAVVLVPISVLFIKLLYQRSGVPIIAGLTRFSTLASQQTRTRSVSWQWLAACPFCGTSLRPGRVGRRFFA